MTLGGRRPRLFRSLFHAGVCLVGFHAGVCLVGVVAFAPAQVSAGGVGWNSQVVEGGSDSTLESERVQEQDPITAEVHLSPAGELSVQLRFVPGTVPPDPLLRSPTGGEQPEPFETSEGGVGLRFPPLSTPDAVTVLRLAQDALRATEGEAALLPVVIRVPAVLEGADIWDLQAALSQAGIRRVRIQPGGG